MTSGGGSLDGHSGKVELTDAEGEALGRSDKAILSTRGRFGGDIVDVVRWIECAEGWCNS